MFISVLSQVMYEIMHFVTNTYIIGAFFFIRAKTISVFRDQKTKISRDCFWLHNEKMPLLGTVVCLLCNKTVLVCFAWHFYPYFILIQRFSLAYLIWNWFLQIFNNRVIITMIKELLYLFHYNNAWIIVISFLDVKQVTVRKVKKKWTQWSKV